MAVSYRIKTLCSLLQPTDVFADIGCDHGYLSIHLLTNGIASSVIASDINEGPLQSAVRNAEKYGVRDKIRFFLSDGVGNIPRDFDTLICAGMGGDTMIHILESAPWLKNAQYRLILQCQSKTPMLRRWLSQQGWRISEESVLRDGRFLYTLMEVYWEPEYPRLTTGEWYFPPALLENPGQDLPAYYQRVVQGLRIKVAGQKENANPELQEALAELESLANDSNLTWLKPEV